MSRLIEHLRSLDRNERFAVLGLAADKKCSAEISK